MKKNNKQMSINDFCSSASESLGGINEILKIKKPLVVFDLEATGLSIAIDKIIEVAYIKIFPDGKKVQDVKKINPGIKIPKESIEIHGITNKDVKNCPSFQDVADELLKVFENNHLSGFNIVNFDLPLLIKEFQEVGKDFSYNKEDVIDAKTIFHYMEPRDLSAAYNFYCGKEHKDAHSAMADVEVTTEILGRQLLQYPQLQDWEFIQEIHKEKADRFVDPDRKFYWRDGLAHFNFGKYRDKELEEVANIDPGFLQWMLGADFGEEVKEVVSGALGGKFPQK